MLQNLKCYIKKEGMSFKNMENAESICQIPEANSTLYINQTSVKKKYMENGLFLWRQVVDRRQQLTGGSFENFNEWRYFGNNQGPEIKMKRQ